MNTKPRKIVFAALIAAIYAAITILLSFSSYGVIQFRVAEALTVLPYFSPIFIPGLFLGCIISNMMSPSGMLDLIFGSSATLIAAAITYMIGRSNMRYKKYLAPLPPVIVNSLIVGIMLHYTINWPLIASIIQVALGEIVCCYGLGLPLLMYIDKNEKIKKYFI